MVINVLINNITKIADNEQAELEKLVASRRLHIETLRSLAKECEQINDPQLSVLLHGLSKSTATLRETYRKCLDANDADAWDLKQAYDEARIVADSVRAVLSDYLQQHGYTYFGAGSLIDTATGAYGFYLEGLHSDSEWNHYDIGQLHMKEQPASE